jgi:hypothetical protein
VAGPEIKVRQSHSLTLVVDVDMSHPDLPSRKDLQLSFWRVVNRQTDSYFFRVCTCTKVPAQGHALPMAAQWPSKAWKQSYGYHLGPTQDTPRKNTCTQEPHWVGGGLEMCKKSKLCFCPILLPYSSHWASLDSTKTPQALSSLLVPGLESPAGATNLATEMANEWMDG